jgi:hypothetical protein
MLEVLIFLFYFLLSNEDDIVAVCAVFVTCICKANFGKLSFLFWKWST